MGRMIENPKVPKYIRDAALEIAGMRPDQRRGPVLGFGDELTEAQYQGLQRWWDSWIAPKLKDIIAGNSQRFHFDFQVAERARGRQHLGIPEVV